MKLYDHQEGVIQRLRAAIKIYDRVCVVMPTGAGKTVIASYIMKGLETNEFQGAFMCHRRELVFQTSQTFLSNNIRYGVIAAGEHPNIFAPIQICSIDTMKNRLDNLPPSFLPKIIMMDECHHSGATGWKTVMNHFKNSKIIGLTATPERLDGKPLGNQYQHMIVGPSTAELIERGFLSNYKLYCPSHVDLHGIPKSGNDFNREVMRQRLEGDTRRIGDIVQHWKKYALNKKTIGFAHNVGDSCRIVAAFKAAGVAAAHLDANTPKAERKSTIMAFAAGTIEVLFNVDLFGEGFDLSAQAGRDVPIEAVILARPTYSLALHLQQIGRALRPCYAPGMPRDTDEQRLAAIAASRKPYAIILDHAGNTLPESLGGMGHGLPDDIRKWSLGGRADRVRAESMSRDNSRQCPSCYMVHHNSPMCPGCHHVYEVGERIIQTVQGDLLETDKEAIRAAQEAEKKEKRMQQGMAETEEELVEIGRRRGYKNPHFWAKKVWGSRKPKKAKPPEPPPHEEYPEGVKA